MSKESFDPGPLFDFMGLYPATKNSLQFSKDAPAVGIFKRVIEEFKALDVIARNATLSVSGSVGRGSWAHIPWIAFLDCRETVTISKGVFPVLFFHKDMKSVVLGLGQGIRSCRPINHGNFGPVPVLRRNSAGLKSLFGVPAGFSTDLPDLGSPGLFPRGYSAGVVFHREFSVPFDEKIFLVYANSLIETYVAAVGNAAAQAGVDNRRASRFPVFEPTLLLNASRAPRSTTPPPHDTKTVTAPRL